MGKIKTIEPLVNNVHINSGASPIVTRIRGSKLQRIIREVAERDEYTCRICYRFTMNGVVDHITPLHLGGSESMANRQWICAEPCHRLKSEKEENERQKMLKGE